MLWYDHFDAVFRALNFTNSSFTNTVSGIMWPAAYSGRSGDGCPLDGRSVNLVLTETNKSSPPVHGFLRVGFDRSGSAKIAGVLPSGAAVTGASRIVDEPSFGSRLLPLALFADGNRSAALSGALLVTPGDRDGSPVSGFLDWASGGRSTTFDVLGNTWSVNPRRNVITGKSDTAICRLEVSGAGPQTLVWPSDNKPSVKTGGGVTFEFDVATGAFSGSVPYVDKSGEKRRMPFRGLIFSSTPSGMQEGFRGCGIQTTRSGLSPVRLFYPQ